MSEPSAVINEEFRSYLRSFHIARDYSERGLEIPNDILETLIENRIERLPEKAYKEEVRHSRDNLEALLGRVWGKHTRKKPIHIIRGGVEGYSFEHIPNSDILEILIRVKDYDEFWKKSIRAIDKQSESGSLDQKGARLLIESREASEFRNGRRFHQLTDDEVKEYERMFGDKHRQMCLNQAYKIISSYDLNPIPVNPPSLIWDNLEFRTQTTHVADKNGNVLFEFDYNLFKNTKDSGIFIGKVVGPYSINTRVDNDIILYSDNTGRHCNMIKVKDDLVLNFYSGSELDIDFIKKIAGIINKKYNSKENIGKRKDNVTKFLENIRLGLKELDPGYFIYPEVTIDNLKGKYEGVEIDKREIMSIFVDDYIGKNRKGNNYESVHVLVSYGEKKQVSTEIQIRDLWMHHIAEEGSASHEDYKEKEEKKIHPESIRLGRAFFGNSTEDNNLFLEIYEKYAVNKINRLKENILSIDSIFTQREQFDQYFDEIVGIYKKSKDLLPKEKSDNILDSIESLTQEYMKSKGLSCVTYFDSISEINDALRVTNEKLSIDIDVKSDEDLHEMIYTFHIGTLYNEFESSIRDARKKDKNRIIAAFCIGAFIKKYRDFYGKYVLSQKKISEYSKRVDKIFRDIIAEQKWRESDQSPVGHLPQYFKKNKKGIDSDFKNRLDNPNNVERFLKGRGLFDHNTIFNIKKVSDEINNAYSTLRKT